MDIYKKLKTSFLYNEKTGRFARLLKSGVRKGVGTLTNKGYLCIRIGNKVFFAHRLAWLYVHGKLPKGEIDHINHCRTDNRIKNLRVVNSQENSRNSSRRKDNSSGVVGVCWYESYSQWRSRITVNGKIKCLGYFSDFKDAVAARKKAEAECGFHKNHGSLSDFRPSINI